MKQTKCERPRACGRTTRTALILVVWWGVVGCGEQRAAPVEPEKARQTLRAALDSWKNGDRPTARAPEIVIQDFDWAAGFQLVDYELAGDGQSFDANLHAPVKLTLRDPKGRSVQKNVTYIVGTSPRLTVFREMMP